MYSIQVVGAGYVGSAIAAYFKSKKQKVSALFRNPAKKEMFEKQGIIPVQADLSHPAGLEKIPPAHFAVISVAPDESTEDAYRRVYMDGVRHYLESLKTKLRPHLIVYISSTSVWKERGGEWVDESISADPDTEKGKILLEAEEQVLRSGYPSVVLRLAGIYGPSRNRLAAYQAGTWPAPGGADRYLNLIHRDDIVELMPVLFNKGKEGEIYTGVDDEPVLLSEMVKWLSVMGSVPLPKVPGLQSGTSNPVLLEGVPVGGKRCSNAKLKSLGYAFKYPSFREGYKGFLNPASNVPEGR